MTFEVKAMKKRLLACGAAVVLAGLLSVGAAVAANPTPINKFSDWVASTYTDNGKTLCYASTEPKKVSGAPKGRAKPYIAVTHAPAANVRDQVSYVAGYEMKPDSQVSITIGKETYALTILQKDRAWAKDPDTDKALVGAMKKGNSVTIKGTTTTGKTVTDTYSLLGFSKAYQAIGAACKIQ
jgi:invasion protein IalB